MRLADRTIAYYRGSQVIRNGRNLLRVEQRDLYTRYRLETYRGTVLWLDVRNCYPLPSYQPRIIYARTIPWFMWIIYGIRDWFAKRRADRQFAAAEKKELARRKAIRDMAEKRMGPGRFGGRYNR